MLQYKNLHISLSVWTACATITVEETNANYLQLRNCPQNSFLDWRIEDGGGVCAESEPGYSDWESAYLVYAGLGYILDAHYHTNDWIRPTNNNINGCGLATSGSSWMDATTVKAYQSNGTIILYYSGKKS